MNFEFIISPQRSRFVTALAWIFIALGAFGTLAGSAQIIMFHSIFPNQELEAALLQAERSGELPASFLMLLQNLGTFALLSILISLLLLIGAIGLIRRRNWGRILLILLLGSGIIWNIGGYFLQMGLLDDLATLFHQKNAPVEFLAFVQIMRGVMMLMLIAFSILFGWLIVKLSSSRIRDEFDFY